MWLTTILACLVTAKKESDSEPDTHSVDTVDTADTDDVVSLTVSISPQTVYNDSTVTCTADSDSDSLSYQWVLNIQGLYVSSDTLNLAQTEALVGDTIKCMVYDTTVSTDIPLGEDSVLIQNRAPEINSIAVSPSAPVEGIDDLSCLATASDPDGDNVVIAYEWKEEGGAVENGALLSAELTSQNETWTCSATASDNSMSSSSSAAVTIAWDGICIYGACDLPVYLGNDIELEMNLIPSGSDPQGRYSLTRDFYMMTTETTQGLFAEVMGYDCLDGLEETYGVGSEIPAYGLSWYMTADFANKVTQLHNAAYGTNYQECYTCTDSGTTDVFCSEAVQPYACDGYALPTLAEWEYAARSGTINNFWTGEGSTLGGTYSSNDCDTSVTINDGVNNPPLSDYAWFCANSGYENHDVAQKLPNGFGLYDMHGNAFEEVADWDGCESYPPSNIDPFCDVVGEHRMSKGGSWGYTPEMLIVGRLWIGLPEERGLLSGVRLLRRLQVISE